MHPAINEEVPLFCLSSLAPRIPKVKGYEERCMSGLEIINTDNVHYSENEAGWVDARALAIRILKLSAREIWIQGVQALSDVSGHFRW